MHKRRRRLLAAAAVVGVAAAVYAALGAASPTDLTSVPSANAKATGVAVPTILSPELYQTVAAQGSYRLENPSADYPYYGYASDGPMLPAPGAVQSAGHNVEATKTEPDKNTYLVLDGQTGPDANYNYGTHFLFQGHESGLGGGPARPPGTSSQKKGYITRINLDADGAHRVTLMATTESDTGRPLEVFDGSTWDPWAQKLLFTAETGNSGGVWQATVTYPSQVQDISGILGRGGYEGIQNDSKGNLYIVEDSGGGFGTVNTKAKQPNSFVYRFLPTDPSDLTAGGKLQALQVISLRSGQPIAFHSGQADADILSSDTLDLHTYGHVFKTHWVTIHDTATDGTTPYDANALAKSKSATPFKRPENGQFQPGSKFKTFFFDETGDTDNTSQAGSNYGGFGDIQKLTQSPKSDDGTLTLFFQGSPTVAGLDNTAFLTKDRVVYVEDRGDTLHGQTALDSAWVFDVNTDYSDQANTPVRMLAQGRDASATLDSGLGSVSGTGFQNDGDNEITGFHVSDGDPSANGILGARIPHPWDGSSSDPNRWRVFYTQQHGDNVTYEILHG